MACVSCCSSVVGLCSRFVRSLCVVRCSLLVVCWLVLGAWCSVVVDCWLLVVDCRLLLLVVGRCALFVVVCGVVVCGFVASFVVARFFLLLDLYGCVLLCVGVS